MDSPQPKFRQWEISDLETSVDNSSFLAFPSNKTKLNSIHIQMGNMVALSYLAKMEGTKRHHTHLNKKRTINNINRIRIPRL